MKIIFDLEKKCMQNLVSFQVGQGAKMGFRDTVEEYQERRNIATVIWSFVFALNRLSPSKHTSRVKERSNKEDLSVT